MEKTNFTSTAMQITDNLRDAGLMADNLRAAILIIFLRSLELEQKDFSLNHFFRDYSRLYDKLDDFVSQNIKQTRISTSSLTRFFKESFSKYNEELLLNSLNDVQRLKSNDFPESSTLIFEQIMELYRFTDKRFSVRHTNPKLQELLVALLKPTPQDRIGDIAASNSGLLFEVVRYLSQNYELDTEEIQQIQQSNLWGVDPSDDLLWAQLSALMGDASSINLWKQDVIFGDPDLNEADFSIQDKRLDAIVTAPPYGKRFNKAQEQQIDSFSSSALEKENERFSRRLSIEHYYLSRAIEILEPGGKLVILLPEGFLFSGNLQFARDWTLKQAHAKAIISFKGSISDVSVQSAILLLQKRHSPLTKLYQAESDDDIYMAYIEDLDSGADLVVQEFHQRTGW